MRSTESALAYWVFGLSLRVVTFIMAPCGCTGTRVLVHDDSAALRELAIGAVSSGHHLSLHAERLVSTILESEQFGAHLIALVLWLEGLVREDHYRTDVGSQTNLCRFIRCS